jgi:hypothetical protein
MDVKGMPTIEETYICIIDGPTERPTMGIADRFDWTGEYIESYVIMPGIFATI